MLFLRKITQDHLLREFRERYIRISGLNVHEDFLRTRDVYARKSRLLHTEQLPFNNRTRTSWIFIGHRSDFFVGVLETFVYKFKNNGKRPVKYKCVNMPLEGKLI